MEVEFKFFVPRFSSVLYALDSIFDPKKFKAKNVYVQNSRFSWLNLCKTTVFYFLRNFRLLVYKTAQYYLLASILQRELFCIGVSFIMIKHHLFTNKGFSNWIPWARRPGVICFRKHYPKQTNEKQESIIQIFIKEQICRS